MTSARSIIASCVVKIRVPNISTEKSSIPLTRREELAEMLGLSEETTSRVMAELRRTGIIEAPRGKIIVLDRDRLQDIADKNPAPRSNPPESSAAL